MTALFISCSHDALSPCYTPRLSGAATLSLRRSVHPPAAGGGKNGQFFHHELRPADRAPHRDSGRRFPFFRHTLASVAAPAFHIGAAGKGATIDLRQIVFVQPRFRRAV